MIYQKYIKRPLVIVGLFAATACASPPAYVYVENQFNRDSIFFLKGKTPVDNVIICYHRSGTTPQLVAALAKSECEKLSKRAVFIEQNLRVCPLVTPFSASYKCAEKKLQ